MTIDKKFQIDKTIVKLMNDKNIKFRTILKSTMQFMMAINLTLKNINTTTESILLDIIDEYENKNTITNELSNMYVSKTTFLTKEQNNIYNSISINNRKVIINKLISIVINNNSYINYLNNDLEIKNDNIINEFTLDFFTSFIKEENNYQATIIWIMESLLFKINRLISNDLLIDSYYKKLFIDVFKRYSKEDQAKEYLLNFQVSRFIYQELGKIYFIMNIKYNMSLKNKSKNLRKWKSKYESILEIKYDNNINNFIKNELNIEQNSFTQVYMSAFGDFLYGFHETDKEKYLITGLLVQYNKICNYSEAS